MAGEWIFMTMRDDNGMSFHALAFESSPAVSHIALLFPHSNASLYRIDDYLLVCLALASILRILHPHALRPTSSTFLPPTSNVISNMIPHQNASSLSSLAPLPFLSPSSGVVISQLGTSDPARGTLPYPNWRTDLTHCARKAGLRVVCRTMD